MTDTPYNPRFDKTGYQRPPKGRIVHTSESHYGPPLPTEPPPTLAPTQDESGKPFLQEVDSPEEGKNLPIEEAPVSTRKPVKLKVGRQTETVTRIVRNRYEVGREFTAKSIYNFFTTDDRTAWRRAYGRQDEVMDVLRKAIVNVKYSKKYLVLESVDGKTGTWKVISLRGALETKKPAPRSKKAPKVTIGDVPVRKLTSVSAPYTLLGQDTDGEFLFISDITGDVGRLTFEAV